MFTKKIRKSLIIIYICLFVLLFVSFGLTSILSELNNYKNSRLDTFFSIYFYVLIGSVWIYCIWFIIYFYINYYNLIKLLKNKDYQKFILLSKQKTSLDLPLFNSIFCVSFCYCGETDKFYDCYKQYKLVKKMIIPYKISLDFITNHSVDKDLLNKATRYNYKYSSKVLQQLDKYLNEDYKNAILNNVSTSNDFFAFVSYIINIRAKKELNIDFSNDLKCAETLKKSLNYQIDIR